jgi:hypothetical protein
MNQVRRKVIIKKNIFMRNYSRVSVTLLTDTNSKQRGEDILEPTIGNKILHQDSNDNGVGIVNFATSKKICC